MENRDLSVKLLGGFSYSLSPDGRIIIPKEFQPHLDEFAPFYLCAGLYEKCLWLMPRDAFFQMLDNLKKICITDREGQELLRIVCGHAEKIPQIGKLGRISIPPRLRKWAQLEEPGTQVEVIGVMDRLEIWNKDLRTAMETKQDQDMERVSNLIFERYRI